MTAGEREALYAFAYYIMQSYGDSDAKGQPLEGGVGKIIRLFTHGWHTENGQLRLAKLGEIWQVNPGQVSEALNDTLTEDAMEIIEGLEDFDFGDI